MSIMLEIRGLPGHFSEEDVFALCDEFGAIDAIRLTDRHGGRREAVVVFDEEWNAELAMSELDGMRIDGNYLQVDLAAPEMTLVHHRAAS